MLRRLRQRQEWKLFGVLPRADRGLAVAWWAVLVLRGLLPAAFAVAMGALVGAVQRGESLGNPLGVVGVVFVLLQVLTPIHQAISANLGSRVAAWLVGGLNFQIEHHLFPRISHVNYPALSTLVEQTCREFGVRYTAFKSFRAGLTSHFRWLRRMGMPDITG